jgi:hypothetical protein
MISKVIPVTVRNDWENEIACWSDIDPLDEVLIEIEPVPEDRVSGLF